ncbi:MAG: sugar ABC transporter permease [Hyphomicrobiaceae bacterium]|nr:sugar ABC transporter permease [Hyphomicrobiaceae bacterium]
MKFSSRIAYVIMAAPVQLLLLLVIGLPAIYVFWLSLQETSFGAAPTFVGLRNYIFVLTDPYFWRSFINTFVVVNIVVYLELAIALGMAAIFAMGVPARRVLISVIIAPYAVSDVVAVVIWKYMFEPDVGLISGLMHIVGLPELAWTTDRWAALTLVGLLSVWLHLPFSFLILYSARMGIPNDLYESASIDGASP